MLLILQVQNKEIDCIEVDKRQWTSDPYINSLKIQLLNNNASLLETLDAEPIFFIRKRFIPLSSFIITEP